MNPRLPIWFQAIAIFLLASVVMTTIAWVGEQDRTLLRTVLGLYQVQDILYLQMPFLVLYLGIRFVGGIGSERCGARWPSRSFVAVAVSMALLFLLMVFRPATQVVRETATRAPRAAGESGERLSRC